MEDIFFGFTDAGGIDRESFESLIESKRRWDKTFIPGLLAEWPFTYRVAETLFGLVEQHRNWFNKDASLKRLDPEVRRQLFNETPNPTITGRTWLVEWESSTYSVDPELKSRGVTCEVPKPLWDFGFIVAPPGVILQRDMRLLLVNAKDLGLKDEARRARSVLLQYEPIRLTKEDLWIYGAAVYWYNRIYWVVDPNEGQKGKGAKKPSRATGR